MAGLRGNTFTTGDDNVADRNDRAKSDVTRGGTQYAINTPPTAALTANPSSGQAPLIVNFDGSLSSDPDQGDNLSYTFDFGDGSAPFTQNSPFVVHQYDQVGQYTASLKVKDSSGFESTTASVQITVSAPTEGECLEDDDARIAYSDGWHLGTSTSASAGHFRWHAGKSPSHAASVTFTVPAGAIGTLTYRYAKSTKGGTAEAFIDGGSRGTISYKGSSGTDKSPQFSSGGALYEVRYEGLSAGQHTFALRNMLDSVFIDGFCLSFTTQAGRS